MSEPLKPCPFCVCTMTQARHKYQGGIATFLEGNHAEDCPLAYLDIMETDESWNRRAPNPLLGLLREARDALLSRTSTRTDAGDMLYCRICHRDGIREVAHEKGCLVARLDAAPEAGDRYREVRSAFVAGSAWGFERDSYLESECEAEAFRRWPDAALAEPGESAGEKGETK